jgi:hypothetical protein
VPKSEINKEKEKYERRREKEGKEKASQVISLYLYAFRAPAASL